MFPPQRSQSGPGLSINTGAANSVTGTSTSQPASGGLFGSKPAASLFSSTTTVAPSAGTLFGTTTTTSAAGSSLFGSTANAPSQAGTLFGGPAAAAQPAQSTSIFGNTSAAPNTTSLFGNTTTTQPQQQSTSLFGNTSTQPRAQSTSLFGNTAQPQQTSSLFGNVTNNTQPATSSLFGSTAPQPQQTTSLFGNMGQTASTSSGLFSNNQQAQQANSSSLFGGNIQQQQQSQQQQQNGGLFGSQQPNNLFNANQSKGLFGASQNTQGGFQQSTLHPAQRTQRSIFSNSIGAHIAEQQTVPGVRINLSELRPTTRFNDLYEGVQKEIETIDTGIYNQIKLAEECESIMPHIATTINLIPADVDLCTRKLEALERSLEADAADIDDAKRLTRKDTEAARLSFRAISSLRMPAHLQSVSNSNAKVAGIGEDAPTSTDLLSYFDAQSEEMSKRLEEMKKQLSEVESYLSSMEANQVAQIQSTRLSHGSDGGVKSAEDQIKEMAGALQSFEGGILNVATRITATRESLGGLILGDHGGRGRR